MAAADGEGQDEVTLGDGPRHQRRGAAPISRLRQLGHRKPQPLGDRAHRRLLAGEAESGHTFDQVAILPRPENEAQVIRADDLGLH